MPSTTFALPAGTVTREIWTGVTGTLISNIPLGTPPNIVNAITSIETPQQWGDYYGQRIRGYIIPQTTGNYTFWIASDDNSQLWLSTDGDPANKTMIAWVYGWTYYQAWNTFSSQKSAQQYLVAGSKYYIEILHKEGVNLDNLSVGWLKPGQSGSIPSEVISSSVLSPYIILTLPNAPGNLSATALSATQIDLTWSDNSNNEEGFRIERALGPGAFVEIGTAAANATIYHDGGLSAETQYRYRIRSYNALGNSGYTSITTITTPEQSTTPTPPPMELSSFAVYSSQKTTLSSQAVFNGGGAVGSDTLVDIFSQATVNGNLLSGGDIIIRSQATINGNATAAGVITVESGATVSGETTENATVAFVEIPAIASIPAGTEKVTIANGENRTLGPGYYDSLLVCTGGTLTLSAGLYTFTNFYVQPDADVVLDIASNDMVEVRVAGDFELSDRSTVVFADEGFVPFIRFYTNDNDMVRIGCDVTLNGTLTAPHGDIHVYSRTQCRGALYGKTIFIEPEAVIVSGDMVDLCADSDGDRIVNIIEMVLGTDPNDPTSYTPMAIPSESCIDNTGEVTITYDFSVYFPDYAFATAMEATFPAGSLTRPYIPLIIEIKNVPDGIPVFDDPDLDPLGRYITFHPANGLADGQSFTLQTPHPQVLSTEEFLPYQYDGSTWEKVQESDISASDATSHTVTYSGTGPIIYAGKRTFSNANRVLYFPGGYVYSNTANSVVRFDINIPKFTEDVDSVAVKVKYLDCSTNPAGDEVLYRKKIEKDENRYKVGTLFYYQGQLVCPGTMKIMEAGLTLFPSTGDSFSCIYQCSANLPILTGQTLVMHSSNNAEEYNPAYYTDPDNPFDPEKLIALYYYPGTETFESSNFGDGRITYNTTPGAPSPFTYEYYLKDHLGSTRMVINDQWTVTEAVMYQPYGTMEQVGSISTAALAVREKFTGKEMDEEGGTVAGVGDGMNLIYFGKRYYDPEIGVWQSTDDASQFVYSYSYCGGNPVGFVDPDGNYVPVFSINKNGMSIGFFHGFGDIGYGGGLNISWKNEFAIGPYAELGIRGGPYGILGLTLNTSTMYGSKSGLYQTGSVGFDVDRIIGAGASTTYSYNRNEFGDINTNINYMNASMSYNTNTGNINYSLSLDNYLVKNSNYRIRNTFSWGDDGFDIGMSGTYQQREIGIDKEFYDWLKGKLKDTKTDKNAPWGETIEVGESQEEVASKIPYYVPNTFWGLIASMVGLHAGWQMRLPGGYHLTTNEETGIIEAHKDYFDPSSGPVQTFLHRWYEVREK